MATTQSTSSPLPPTSTGPVRDFVFIDQTKPGGQSNATRKKVRAQAARGLHANFHVGETSSTKTDADLRNHQQAKRQTKRSKIAKAKGDILSNIETAASASSSFPKRDEGENFSILMSSEAQGSGKAHENDPATIENDGLSSSAVPMPVSRFAPPTLRHETSHSSDSSGTTLVPSVSGSGWVAPFVSYHETTRPFIPVLFQHYLTYMATEIPELDAGSPAILRTTWLPMALTSPATLGVVLLTTASHYAAWYGLPRQSVQRVLLDLKHHTLNSINKHIRSTPANEPMSDIVLGSVAKMASYEAMFGSGDLYHTHMRGLVRMIEGRGGLERLTGLKGLMHRMMLWIDVNSAWILGSKPYFVATQPLAGNTGEGWVANAGGGKPLGEESLIVNTGAITGTDGLDDQSGRYVIGSEATGIAPNPGGFLSCFNENEVLDVGVRKQRGGWDSSHETAVQDTVDEKSFENVEV